MNTATLTIKPAYNGFHFEVDGKATAPSEIPREVLQANDLDALLHAAATSGMSDDLRDAAGMIILRMKARRATRVIVTARRWFSRSQGNTYHTVTVLDADTRRTLYYSGLAWGYDRQYMVTAIEGLAAAMGEDKPERMAPSRWFESHGIELVGEHVEDVKRKCDL